MAHAAQGAEGGSIPVNIETITATLKAQLSHPNFVVHVAHPLDRDEVHIVVSSSNYSQVRITGHEWEEMQDMDDDIAGHWVNAKVWGCLALLQGELEDRVDELEVVTGAPR